MPRSKVFVSCAVHAARVLACMLVASSAIAQAGPTPTPPPVAYPSPAAAPPPLAAWYEDEQAERAERRRHLHDLRAEERLRRQESREEARAERQSQRAVASALVRRDQETRFAQERRPRAVVSLGTASGLVGRDTAEGVARIRQGAIELGLGYIQAVAPSVAMRANFWAGIGRTRLGVGSAIPLDSDDYEIAQAGRSYALSLDAAPVISPLSSGFYIAPGLVTRVIVLTQTRVEFVVDNGNGSVVEKFRSPVVVAAARIGVGYRFGENRMFDIGAGLDAGAALRDSDRYFGLVTRFGVALPSRAP